MHSLLTTGKICNLEAFRSMTGNILLIFMGILFFSVILTALAAGYLVRRREEKKMDEYQDQILRTQREEIEAIYRTMRGWKHDYHNHMQKIKAHLAMDQLEEVNRYLDQLAVDLDAIDIAIRTGNVSLDAILSSKLSVAGSKKIAINCKAAVPKELTVHDVDLCVIIGNLIDNGVESCLKIKENERRFIRVYIGRFKDQLYISVTNSTGEKRRKNCHEWISAKGGNHGHGLKRIDRIVEKYDGFINRQNEPGVFATEILLPL